jgi:hypothetical protein
MNIWKEAVVSFVLFTDVVNGYNYGVGTDHRWDDDRGKPNYWKINLS